MAKSSNAAVQHPAQKPATAGLDLPSARFPLGLKISAMMAAIIVTLGAVTFGVAADQMSDALTEEFRTKGTGIARGLATASVSLLLRDDRPKVQSFVDEFSKTEGVAYVAINDPTGEISSHSLGGSFPKDLHAAIIGEGEVMGADAALAVAEVRVEGFGDILEISHPIMNGALGRAHVGLKLERMDEQIARLWYRLGIVFLVFSVIGLGAAFIFGRVVVRPLFNMVGVVVEVSTGNLQVEAKAQSKDEFSALSRSVNEMIFSLKNIVSSVRIASVQVNDAAEEIVATSTDQERGVREQVTSIEEISQTMNALADTARAIANNADSLTGLAEHMSATVKTGQDTLNVSRDAMSQIVEKNRIIDDRINKLYEQSQAIISVIDIIDNISDRLDLLALNAALEGSRAGEVGKGFSLVAHEMRRLAENVTGSTKEIKDTVREIHGLTQAALEASQQGSEATTGGAVEMQKTVDVMSRIFGLIEQTTEAARQITVITQQQLSSSQQIVAAMRDVAAIATGGMTSAQQVTKAAQEQARLSATLSEQVALFRLDRGSADAPADQAEP